jgi:hypothetical protein
MPTIIGIKAAHWLWGKSWGNKKLTTGTFKDPLPMTQESGSGFFFGRTLCLLNGRQAEKGLS